MPVKNYNYLFSIIILFLLLLSTIIIYNVENFICAKGSLSARSLYVPSRIKSRETCRVDSRCLRQRAGSIITIGGTLSIAAGQKRNSERQNAHGPSRYFLYPRALSRRPLASPVIGHTRDHKNSHFILWAINFTEDATRTPYGNASARRGLARRNARSGGSTFTVKNGGAR